MKSEIDKILDILGKAQRRVEELQAQVVEQQAANNAILLCLRDLTKADPQKLEAAFRHYKKEVHQKILEIIEDGDAEEAARLDKRPLL
jgi:hypothetical protein